MQQAIQKEIVAYWRPPAGVDKKCVCVFNILVDWDGRVKRITPRRSSRVLMYDVSARSAMLAMTLPKWARGKEFTITFKQ